MTTCFVSVQKGKVAAETRLTILVVLSHSVGQGMKHGISSGKAFVYSTPIPHILRTVSVRERPRASRDGTFIPMVHMGWDLPSR